MLRGFSKVALGAGGSQLVSLPLCLSDVSIWDTVAQRWAAIPGVFGVTIGASSRDLRLNSTVTVTA